MESSPLYLWSFKHIRYIYNFIVKTKIYKNGNNDKIKKIKLIYNNNFNLINKIRHIHLLCEEYNLNLSELIDNFKDIHNINNEMNYKIQLQNLLSNHQEKECEICYYKKDCYKYWLCSHYICKLCYDKWYKSCPYCRTEQINMYQLPTIGSYYLYRIKGRNVSYLIIILGEAYDGYIYKYTGYYISFDNLRNQKLQFRFDMSLLTIGKIILKFQDIYDSLLRDKLNFMKIDEKKIKVKFYDSYYEYCDI